MTPDLVFFIIISILFAGFVFEQLVDYLNRKSFSEPIPTLLSDIYNQAEYAKNQKYLKTNAGFGLIHEIFSFVIILLMLFLGGFAFLDNFLLTYIQNPMFLATAYLLALMLASALLDLPFSWYHTFVVEEEYGFNKTSKKTFFLDAIKSVLLTVILGGMLIYLLVWFYQQFQQYFWIYAWMAFSAFSLFMTLFYSNLIVPLFNKQTPLQQGELRTELEKFAQHVGFQIRDIYVIDGSKRSTKANAYFTGFGPKKRIVLYDTLISDLSSDEIIAVLAHEIGHYKHKHVISSIFISLIYSGIMLYLLSLFLQYPVFSQALGVETGKIHIALISFGILYSPISLIIGIFMNKLSRKNEYQADAFAAKYYNAESLISALKKLSQKSLSNLTPHRWYVFLNYSHPTLYQRIKALYNE
jgi:STE24 endopeptidase